MLLYGNCFLKIHFVFYVNFLSTSSSFSLPKTKVMFRATKVLQADDKPAAQQKPQPSASADAKTIVCKKNNQF